MIFLMLIMLPLQPPQPNTLLGAEGRRITLVLFRGQWHSEAEQASLLSFLGAEPCRQFVRGGHGAAAAPPRPSEASFSG